MQRRALQELVDIQTGYSFRGRLPLSESGDAWVVQFRHIVVGARLNDGTGAGLDRANLTGRKQATFLKPGDILFMANAVWPEPAFDLVAKAGNQDRADQTRQSSAERKTRAHALDSEKGSHQARLVQFPATTGPLR